MRISDWSSDVCSSDLSSAWIWVLLAAHLGVVLAWWQLGWRVGLLLLVAVHLAFLWGALRPRSAMYGPVLSHLPVTDRRVWLTIDDGPSDDTPALLDLLEAHGAKATFFLVGERAAARPDLVRGIAARSEEHTSELQSLMRISYAV